MVVAQLEERLLATPEVRGSNPVICKLLYYLYTVNCIEKTKIKLKRPGMDHLKGLFDESSREPKVCYIQTLRCD